jgi:ParB family chromosome partitioning protein
LCFPLIKGTIYSAEFGPKKKIGTFYRLIISLANLKNSISTNSLLDPILVKYNEDKEGFYPIVDGERRWRASKALNLTMIKCRIVMSDKEGYAIVALTQNLHRDDLLPIEKASAFSQLSTRLQGEDENVRQN